MQLEVGSIVEGKVTGVTKFGAFVELENGKVGLVHISEISRTFVKEVRDHVQENQKVKVKILSLGDNNKIELSIKQAEAPMPKEQNVTVAYRSPSRNNISAQGRQSSPANSFEDMMSKFKKVSDERLVDFNKKSESRKGKSYGKK